MRGRNITHLALSLMRQTNWPELSELPLLPCESGYQAYDHVEHRGIRYIESYDILQGVRRCRVDVERCADGRRAWVVDSLCDRHNYAGRVRAYLPALLAAMGGPAQGSDLNVSSADFADLPLIPGDTACFDCHTRERDFVLEKRRVSGGGAYMGAPELTFEGDFADLRVCRDRAKCQARAGERR